MSKLSGIWDFCTDIGDALVASGYFSTFYAGLPRVIPDAQQKVLVLEIESEDDETGSVGNPWSANYLWQIMVSDPSAGESQLVGTALNPGLSLLVNTVRESLSVNFTNYGAIDDFELGPVNYGFRKSHPNRVAQFTLNVKGFLNPRDRGTGVYAGSVVVNALPGVVITNPQDGQFLTYSGSNWINEPEFLVTTGDVPFSIPVLGTIPTTTNGDMFTYNDGTSILWCLNVTGRVFSITMSGHNV